MTNRAVESEQPLKAVNRQGGNYDIMTVINHERFSSSRKQAMSRIMDSPRHEIVSRSSGMTRKQSRRGGFTLVEILVVLVIIAILVAILLPVFRSAQERGYQANCASNLQQIGIAEKLYYQDEKRHPGSLAFLLPNTERLDNTSGASSAASCDDTTVPGVKTCGNTGGGGYLKSAKSLICPDDDSVSAAPRASYGSLSTETRTVAPTTAADTSLFVWNYWGYNNFGIAYPTADIAKTKYDGPPALPRQLLVDPTNAYNPASGSGQNLVKKSLSNRFAPDDTIITHCVYHRGPTSGVQAELLYGGTPPGGTVAAGGSSAVDIVLSLNGSAKTVIVGAWNVATDITATPPNISPWQEQKF